MIEVKNIWKSFGSLPVLKGVNLQIKKGEIVKKLPQSELLGALKEELDNWK